MDAEITYLRLKNLALQEFPDIVVYTSLLKGPLNVAESLRIFFVDNYFLEIWVGGNKYSYHWQKTDGTIFRHDNAPHKKHRHIKTFPKHFHDVSENNVKESYLSDNPNNALIGILGFIRKKIK